MIDFGVDIKIEGSTSEQAIKRVTAELERNERAAKAAKEAVKQKMAEGSIAANQEAEAVKKLTREFANSEVAIEQAQQAAKGFLGQLGASSAISTMVSEAAELTANFGLAGQAIGGVVGKVTGAIDAFASWHVGMLAMNDTLIEMRNRLRNVSDGNLGLGFAQGNTRGIADRTSTDVGTTVDVYARLKNATQDLGLSQGHVAQLTETLGKAFQSSGRSAGENAAAMLQLSQALGSGRLQGDEFRSMSENAPQLLRAFSQELGVTTGELRKMSSEGKITTDVMIAAFDHMADGVDRSFDRMEKTFAQKVRPLLNELQADPNKVNRAAAGNLGDAADIFNKGMESGLFRSSAAETAVFGESISFGNNQLAEMARIVQDTQAKIEQYRASIEGTTKTQDAWSNTNTTEALLPLDKQVQELTLHIQEMNSPDIALKGAQIWSTLQKGVKDFAKDAVDGLTDVRDKLVDVGLLTGPTNGVLGDLSVALKKRVDKFVADQGGWTETFADNTNKATGKLSDLEKLFHSIVDPLNHFNRDVHNLDTLFAQHRVTLEQYNRELEKLKSHLDAADLASTQFATHSILGGGFGPQPAINSQLDIGNDINNRTARDLLPFDWWANANARRAQEMQSLNQALYSGTGPRNGNTFTAQDQEQAALYTKRWTEELEKNKKAWEDVDKFGQQTMGHIEDAMVQLVQTGKFSFKGLVDSILADLTRLATHRLLMSLINGLAGGGGTASVFGTGATQSFQGLYGGGHATGGVWRAPMTGGGPDSIPVMFHMSPGETASFAPQGQQQSGGSVRAKVVYNEDRRALLDMLDTPDGVAVLAEVHRKNPHLTRRR